LLLYPAATAWCCTLSLHDALPICFQAAVGRLVEAALTERLGQVAGAGRVAFGFVVRVAVAAPVTQLLHQLRGRVAKMQRHGLRADRKSTRLNSSHVKISYAVFCLK